MEKIKKVKENLTRVNKEITTYIKNSSKSIKPPTIIAVTKNQPIESWNKLLELNITDIGENRVQETIEKIKNFSQKLQFKIHLIGHLQKNKVKQAIKIYDVIQTVHSLELAKKINKYSEKLKKQQEIYIQVNISKDAQKYGVFKEELIGMVEEIKKLDNIKLTGLMTILQQGLSDKEASYYYRNIKELQEKIQKTVCLTCKNTSMGMSGDFKIAIGSGSTHVRLGRKIFD